MTELKVFQIRDDGTHIPALCVLLLATEDFESRELKWAGFGLGTRYFLLTKLNTMETHYDPFRWDDRVTMWTIHRHIEQHWDSLVSGQVLDAQFIRGETAVCKEPE